MKKYLFVFLIFLISSLVAATCDAITYTPQSRQIGQSCNDNSDCVTGDCEDSAYDMSNDNFCVCQIETDCETKYGSQPGDVWACKDGIPASQDLHYCLKKDKDGKETNYFPGTAEQILEDIKNNTILEPPSAASALVGKAPILPVLGSICKLEDITADEPNPWIAQCIGGLYRYILVFGSALAVLLIMIGGMFYIFAGARPESVSSAKKIMWGSVIGLVTLLLSFLVLNLINPELVNLKALYIETVKLEKVDIVEQSEVNAPTNWPSGKTIAATPTSIAEVGPAMFKVDTINNKPADGWALWSSFTDTEKQLILPFLKKQIAVCDASQLVKITDISGWGGIQIHPAVYPAFREANKIAQGYGFKLVPGSIFRNSTENGIPLWNTGIVGRYQQYRDKVTNDKGTILVPDNSWQTNQGRISSPKCSSPHNTGGAVDVSLVS